jgi:hypothetical protein
MINHVNNKPEGQRPTTPNKGKEAGTPTNLINHNTEKTKGLFPLGCGDHNYSQYAVLNNSLMKTHCNGALFLVIWTSTFHLRALTELETEVINVRDVANISHVENSRENLKGTNVLNF